jgi:hypothetical protein
VLIWSGVVVLFHTEKNNNFVIRRRQSISELNICILFIPLHEMHVSRNLQLWYVMRRIKLHEYGASKQRRLIMCAPIDRQQSPLATVVAELVLAALDRGRLALGMSTSCVQGLGSKRATYPKEYATQQHTDHAFWSKSRVSNSVELSRMLAASVVLPLGFSGFLHMQR